MVNQAVSGRSEEGEGQGKEVGEEENEGRTKRGTEGTGWVVGEKKTYSTTLEPLSSSLPSVPFQSHLLRPLALQKENENNKSWQCRERVRKGQKVDGEEVADTERRNRKWLS